MGRQGDRCHRSILAVSAAAGEVSDKLSHDASNASKNRLILLLTLLALSLPFTLFIMNEVRIKLSHLEHLRASMANLSSGSGDLTKRLDASSSDEVGATGSAFNKSWKNCRPWFSTYANILSKLPPPLRNFPPHRPAYKKALSNKARLRLALLLP